MSALKKIVVLFSGRGSNLEALLNAKAEATFVAAISNVPGAGGLSIAAAYGLPTAVIDHRAHANRESFEAALAPQIDEFAPDLVLLAGFMRVLTPRFVERYRGRMLNIHPSLLPAFPGLHTHRRALEAGVRIHGCTVHFVTPTLDGGPIVIQAAVPVLVGDDEDALAARVLLQEHRIYPEAVRWCCEGRVRLDSDGTPQIQRPGEAVGVLISPPLSETRRG